MASNRIGTLPFSVRQLVVACVVGVVVGVSLFVLSSMEPDQRSIGLCQPTTEAGFDPWTGLPHGATIYCSGLEIQTGPTAAPSVTQTASTYQTPAPPSIANRQAVPVPIGFATGVLAVLLPLGLMQARQRRR